MNFRNCFLILIICLFSIALVKAAGEVDTSFNASYYTSSTGSIKRIFVQPDGKFLVGGTFKAINGKSYNGIARFNTDGTLDTNFTPPDLYSLNGTIVKGADVNAIAMQSTGKILIGGNFLGYDSTPAPGILRLNPNGTIDTTFVSSSGITTDIKVFPDDKFMLAKGNDTKRNADGTLDTSSLINYNTIYSKAVAIQPDGSVISAQQDIIRYDPSGILDTAFTVTTNGEVKELISQPDGKILVGGTFTQINNGFPARGIIRLNPNGSIDTSFIGLTNGASKNVNGITLLPNGKIAIAGDFANYSGVNRLGVAILNSDGSLDNSFVNTNNFSNINDIDILNDGKIIIGGDAIFNSQSALIIANANGSFNSEPKIGNTIRNNRVAIQTDGKILVGGGSNYASNLVTNRIARFNGNDGSVDTSFLSSLTSSMNLINAMILEQPQGSIIAGGDLNGYRFTSNGTMVVTTNLNFIRDIKRRADGKFIFVGDPFVRLYNTSLLFDSSFAVTVDQSVKVVEFQPDGKILIAGDFTTVNGTARGRIARLNADGTLDTTFNPLGGANSTIYDIALQPDGKIIIGGNFNAFAFNSAYQRLIRLNSDGSIDTSFTPNVNSTILSLKLQPNGKILIGGAFFSVNGSSINGITRLNSNGTLDTTFNIGTGVNGNVWDIELQTDGKIVYCGEFSRTNGYSTLGIGRLLNDNVNSVRPAPFDFDGDGKSDFTVFRPSNRFWYGLQSSNSAFYQFNFGAVGDILAPADYNFDGKCDIAIFRNGEWWYQATNGQHTQAAVWGLAGDKPIPSDWDGDGKSDFIVFRPSNGVWYRISSVTGQMSFLQFGIAEDIPLQADFDGDGKSDVAVYRPSTGTWYWLNSSNNQFAGVPFGAVGDIPQTGDYDGDGKTDIAVYRPSNGYWYFLYSGSGYSFGAIPFGTAEDRPVVGDYDGDGKTDIAVFRPSTGNWFLQRTTQGFFGGIFGTNGDIPIPSAYYP